MGQCLKISKGTFCQKTADSNAISGSTLSILLLDQFSRRIEQALFLEVTVVQLKINFKFTSCSS